MNIKRIELEGQLNTRDLGEITCGSVKIKPKRIIRSGELSCCSNKDKDILLNKYNLKKVVDLRTDVEIEECPNPIWEGVEYLHLPVFDAEVMGITRDGRSLNDMVALLMSKGDDAAKKYMTEIYKKIIAGDMAKSAYRNLLGVLAENQEGAVLFNCSAGKDRTGTGAILLLTIFGFDKEEIYTDYYSTNAFVEKSINAFAEKIYKATGLDAITAAKYLLGVNRDYFDAIYSVMESEYGSVLKYITNGLDLSNRDIEKLREMYIEQ